MREITIIQAENNTPLTEYTISSIVLDTPEGIRADISQYRRWQDRQARLLARHLLGIGLRRRGVLAAGLSLGGDAAGRPRLRSAAGEPLPDLGISHTDGRVVVALGWGVRVGVDVEALAPRPAEDLRSAFADEEWREALAAPEPERELLRLWTVKEAVLKADGRGLAVDPRRVDGRARPVRLDGVSWHVEEVEAGAGFVCHLAADAPARVETTLHRLRQAGEGGV